MCGDAKRRLSQNGLHCLEMGRNETGHSFGGGDLREKNTRDGGVACEMRHVTPVFCVVRGRATWQ